MSCTHCLPIGEHNDVPLSDLANNKAVQYLLSNPKSKPRWCLRKSPHDIETCTFLHRHPDKAIGYVTVRGEPAPVSIADLLHNKGLEMAMNAPETFAEWCSVAAPHEVATCKNLHLGEVKNDKTVQIEGEDMPVNVSHLLLNRGVSYLLTARNAKGVWCNNKIIHDVLACPYIHRRIDDHPQVIHVEDEKFPVPVKDLIRNSALEFLLENPQYSGRWCSRMVKHQPEDCGFLHRIHPFIRVDGESIRISSLRANRGLKYVLEHPEAQGHWCKGKHDEAHPIETCTFIHYKDENRQRRTEGGGSDRRRHHSDRGDDRRGGDRGSNTTTTTATGPDGTLLEGVFLVTRSERDRSRDRDGGDRRRGDRSDRNDREPRDSRDYRSDRNDRSDRDRDHHRHDRDHRSDRDHHHHRAPASALAVAPPTSSSTATPAVVAEAAAPVVADRRESRGDRSTADRNDHHRSSDHRVERSDRERRYRSDRDVPPAPHPPSSSNYDGGHRSSRADRHDRREERYRNSNNNNNDRDRNDSRRDASRDRADTNRRSGGGGGGGGGGSSGDVRSSAIDNHHRSDRERRYLERESKRRE